MTTPEKLGKGSYSLLSPGGHPALLLHGLTATPDEMDSLAVLLQKLGFSVYVPLLPGHGTTISDLGKVTTSQFLAAADEAFEEAARLGPDEVFIVGSSFSTLLALYLAGKYHRKVKGCVLLALPWKLRSAGTEALLKTLSLFPEFILSRLGSIKKKNRPHIHFTSPLVRYDRHAIGAVTRLFKLQRRITSYVPKVSCRVMALEDPADHYLAQDASAAFQEKFDGKKIELEFIPGAEHELLVGPKATTVEARILHFVDSLYHLKAW